MAENFSEDDSLKTAETNLKKLLEVALSNDLPNGLQLDDSLLQQFQDVSSSINEPLNDRYSMPKFFQDCSEGKYEEVEEYLKSGQDPNEVGKKGETALMCATSNNHANIIKLLLEFQASPNLIIENSDSSPLIDAATFGSLEIVQLLLHYGADPDYKTPSNKMALHVAAAGGHYGICSVILEKSRNKMDLIEQQNENGHTALMEAATSGSLVLVKLLINIGAQVNISSAEFKETALTLASYKGYDEIVAFLLDSGADHDHKTDEMHTALMEAAMEGHYKAAKVLLEYGAHTNIRHDSFETSLTLAACSGHIDLLALLLWYGSDIEEINDELYTPLMEACREGHIECALLLIGCGAKINRLTDETQESAFSLATCGADIELGSSTALMEASQEGHVEIVKTLLRLGARVEARNAANETSMHYAAENGHMDVIHVLIDAGATIEPISDEGKTPLMKAARSGHLEVVKFFVQCGANVNRVTANKDQTALTLACGNGQSLVVDYLLQVGADPSVYLKDNNTLISEACRSGHVGVLKFLLGQGHPEIQNLVNPNLISNFPSDSNVNSTNIISQYHVQQQQHQHHLHHHHHHHYHHTNNNDCSNIDTLQNPQMLLPSSPDNNSATTNVTTTPPSSLDFVFNQPNNQQINRSKIDESALPIIGWDTKLLQNMDPNTNNLEELVKCIYPGFSPIICQNNSAPPPPPPPPPPLASSNPSSLFSSLDQAATVTNIIDAQLLTHSNSSSIKSPYSATQQINTSNRKIKKARHHSDLYNSSHSTQSITIEELDDTNNTNTTTNNNSSFNSNNISISSSSSSPSIMTTVSSSSLLSSGSGSVSFIDQCNISNSMSDISNYTQPNHNNATITMSVSTDGIILSDHINKTNAHDLSNTNNNFSPNNSSDDDRGSSEPKRIAIKSNMTNNHSIVNMRVSNLFSTTSTITTNTVNTGVTQPSTPTTPNNPNLTSFYSSPISTTSPTTNILDLSSSTSSSISLSPIKPVHFHKQVLQPKRRLQQTQKIISPIIRNNNIVTNNNNNNNSFSIPVENNSNNNNINTLNSGFSSAFDVSHKLINQFKSLSQPDSSSTNVSSTNNLFSAPDFNYNFNFSDKTTYSHPQFKPHCDQLHHKSSSSSSPAPVIGSSSSISISTSNDSNHRLSSNSPVISTDISSTINNTIFSTSTPNITSTTHPCIKKQQCCMDDVNFDFINNNNNMSHFNLSQDHHNLGVVQELDNEDEFGNCAECNRTSQQNAYLNQTAQFPIISSSDTSQVPSSRYRRAAGTIESKRPHSSPTQTPTQTIQHQQIALTQQTQQPNIQTQVPININVVTESMQESPLTLAAIHGHQEVIRVLVQNGARLEHRDKKSQTPLHCAVINGHIQCVQVLLDLGADIEALLERNKDSPLGLAAAHGRADIVRELANRGAALEHRNLSDYTPLCVAANGGHLETVRELLSAGAEINSRTNSRLGISPLMLAAMNGHVEVVEELLTRGSDINAQIETNRNSALTLACSQGRTEVVRLLVERSVSLEHRPKSGLTPLMETATQGHVAVGEILLNAGADPNSGPVLPSRDTALIMAAEKGHTEFVKLLLNHGANVDVRNKKGDSALWLASSGGYLDIVKLLLNCGADPNTTDNRRITCLMAAFLRGHIDVVQELVKHVTQFPQEIDCNKHIKSLMKQQESIAKKCETCKAIIIEAKERQEFEAAKNAKNLLEEVEKERKLKELKESKLAKKREKRKAKKKAKQESTATTSTLSTTTTTTNLTNVPISNENHSKSNSFSSKSSSNNDKECNNQENNSENINPLLFLDTTSCKANDYLETSNIKKSSTEDGSIKPTTTTDNPPSKHMNGVVNKVKKEKQQQVSVVSSSLSNKQSSHSEKSCTTSRTTCTTKTWTKTEQKSIGNNQNIDIKSCNSTNSTIVSTSTTISATTNNQTPVHNWHTIGINKRKVELHIPVNKKEIGKVIGQGGSVVNAIRQISGAHIDIDSTANLKDERIVHLKGLNDAVLKAKELIQDLVEGRVTGIDVVHDSSSTSSSTSILTNVPTQITTPQTTQIIKSGPINELSQSQYVPDNNYNYQQNNMNHVNTTVSQQKNALPIIKTGAKMLSQHNASTTLINNNNSNNNNYNNNHNPVTTASLPQYGFSKSFAKPPISDFASVAAAGIITTSTTRTSTMNYKPVSITQSSSASTSSTSTSSSLHYTSEQNYINTSSSQKLHTQQQTQQQHNYTTHTTPPLLNSQFPSLSEANNCTKQQNDTNTNCKQSNNAIKEPLEINTVTLNATIPSNNMNNNKSPSAPISKSFPLAPGSERSMHQRTYNSTPEHSPQIPDHNNNNNNNNTTNTSSTNSNGNIRALNEIHSSDSAIGSNNSDKDDLCDFNTIHPPLMHQLDDMIFDKTISTNHDTNNNNNNTNMLMSNYPKLNNLNPQAQVFSPNYFPLPPDDYQLYDSNYVTNKLPHIIDTTQSIITTTITSTTITTPSSSASIIPTQQSQNIIQQQQPNSNTTYYPANLISTQPQLLQTAAAAAAALQNFPQQTLISSATAPLTQSPQHQEERTIRIQDHINDALNLLITNGIDRTFAEQCFSSFMQSTQLDLNSYMTSSEFQMIITSLLSPTSMLDSPTFSSMLAPQPTQHFHTNPHINDTYTTVSQPLPPVQPQGPRLPYSTQPMQHRSLYPNTNRWAAPQTNANNNSPATLTRWPTPPNIVGSGTNTGATPLSLTSNTNTSIWARPYHPTQTPQHSFLPITNNTPNNNNIYMQPPIGSTVTSVNNGPHQPLTSSLLQQQQQQSLFLHKQYSTSTTQQSAPLSFNASTKKISSNSVNSIDNSNNVSSNNSFKSPAATSNSNNCGVNSTLKQTNNINQTLDSKREV